LLSQHVEVRHIVSLATAGYFGYLLKDRVLDVDDFLEALERVARGGSVLDPEVVGQLVAANRDSGVLAALTEREQEVLSLMAEGLTNAGIARRLWLTERTTCSPSSASSTSPAAIAESSRSSHCSRPAAASGRRAPSPVMKLRGLGRREWELDARELLGEDPQTLSHLDI
jgi:FixJ family two-component response regulator